jgi:radical SAM superfamily enzyme YgiQ (UPF0313 family)
MFPEAASIRIVDCIAERMTWARFERLLEETRPRYYVTHATAPTLTNDMRGVYLAKALSATTVAIGTHVTPAAADTLQAYPALDFAVRGEPDETVRELIDVLESVRQRSDDDDENARWRDLPGALDPVRGVAYRRDGRVVVNPDRPFIEDLDSLPIPRHELLPLEAYRLPIVGGRYTFVVTSRGCPGGCTFCIKHVTYQDTVRLRSPEHILREVRRLVELGTTNIHFEADLFTVNRDQVAGICELLLEQRTPVRWTCNSRVDFVDEELLGLMGRAGCWMISWGIESGAPEILRRARKGIDLEQVEQALRWAKAARIRNWGYFILGLPGETAETIERTIAFSKRLPLDLALFHIAVPYPGTPFWFEARERGWLRVRRWEDFDMYSSTVVEYPGLSAAEIARAARRASRAWSLRPGPVWTFVKELRNGETRGQLARIGIRYLGWLAGGRKRTCAVRVGGRGMVSVKEQIVERLDDLPEPNLREGLGFAEFLTWRGTGQGEPLLSVAGTLRGEPLSAEEIETELYGNGAAQ